MSHKLVGFSNSINSSYIQSQLVSIANEISDLETEFANENDDRLTRYCKRPDKEREKRNCDICPKFCC